MSTGVLDILDDSELTDICTDRALAKKSLRGFVEAAWEHVAPQALVPAYHVHAICEHLQAVTEGQIKNLLINIPPGCSKSMLTSVLWSAWEWSLNPKIRWMFFSYDARLSTRDSVKCRELIEGDWYRKRWPGVAMRRDQNQKTYYENTAGGYRLSTTTGGHATGEHPHRIVGDDPHDVAGAESRNEREADCEWWDLAISSRGLSMGVRKVVIMQRLHQADLSGHILKEDHDNEWDHLLLPMRYEPDRAKVTSIGFKDPRTKPGQLLSEELFPEPVVLGLERRLGTYGTAGQLQQRPDAREGAMFKVDRLIWVPQKDFNPNRIKRVVRAWDKAGTKDAGCYTAGGLIGIDVDDNPWIIDMVRERWSTDEVENQIDLWSRIDEQRYGREKADTVFEIEPGASGKHSARITLKRLQGRRCRGVAPQGSKIVRAEPLATTINMHEMRILEGPWNTALVEELRMFPASEFADQVDSLSLGYTQVTMDSDWMPAGEDEDGEPIGIHACNHPECDRLSDPDDGEYCCPGCRLAHARKQKVDNSTHSPHCNARHGQLYAKGKWEPAGRISPVR